MVKNPDSESNDDIKIPFVKVTIPKDACEPLPKVHHGGIFGAVFNFASELVDGTLDDACHLVFPIVKGIKLPLPDWLTFDIYPPQESFPDNPDEDKSSKRSSTSTSSLSSSSSTCRPSAVPRCTNSCAISGTVTHGCTSVCSTITTCSGTATTTSIASSTCSASAVSSCIASCAVSAGSTQRCSTVCSTISACSRTATTSSTISSVNATNTQTAYEHSVPLDYISIQEAIQSELAKAFATASGSLDASSDISMELSWSAAQYSSSVFATGSQQISNNSVSSTQFVTSKVSSSQNNFESSSLPSASATKKTGSVTSSGTSSSCPFNNPIDCWFGSESSTPFPALATATVTPAPHSKTTLPSTHAASTTTLPSTHAASTTTPAIEATTPVNMFEMNFWHKTDENKKSTGNLWYMYVNKLVDINLSRVNLCQISGKAGIEDQNITNTDPLPNPIPYPQGTWFLPTDGAGNGCNYKGDRSGAGVVICPGKPTVSCQGNVGDEPVICDPFTSIYPMVLCGLEN
ncbi:hypothetical protein NHQ30_004032 [Ciborinia camelliae]|nr:hypothetical protein NHQ30_004032 [Ciborinia camelliae]